MKMATGLEQVRAILRRYEEKSKQDFQNPKSPRDVPYSTNSQLEAWGDLVEEHPVGCAGGRR